MESGAAQKIKILFSKTGDLKFISHLDLVRLFQRSSRRAGLPVTITKGYNPRFKISITRALKLGAESRAEEAIFFMDRRVEPEKFAAAMNEKLPGGIRVESAEEIK